MSDSIKKMAELLRSGGTMLQETCPVCGSPLFRSGDKVLCVKCGKDFSSAYGTSSTPGSIKDLVPRISSTIVNRLGAVEAEIEKTTDSSKLLQQAKIMLVLLRIVRLLEEMKKPR